MVINKMIKISYSDIKGKLAKCKDSIRELGRRSSPIHDSLESCEHDNPYEGVRTYDQAVEKAVKIVAQFFKEAEIVKERKPMPKVDASKVSSYARGFGRDPRSEEERLLAEKMDVFSKGITEQEMKKISKNDIPFSALKLIKELEEN